MALPASLYLAAQVRELDRRAVSELHIDSYHLMQRAGSVAWEILSTVWPRTVRLSVICGGGNNGGDGYVLAARALEQGLRVNVQSAVDPQALTGDARQAYQEFMAKSGARCEPINPEQMAAADVVVDALLGIGLDRNVSGVFHEAIKAMNDSDKPVLALDIPSGLNADTGAAMGAAVCADVTITFIALKQGMFTGHGRGCCGRIEYADLGVPESVFKNVVPSALRMDLTTWSRLLTPRLRHGHKGDYGHVLVIGGDYGFTGAARMAAEAAARTGAGLVSLATRPEPAMAVSAAMPVIMAHGVTRAAELQPLMEKATVVAIGPGLGQSEWGSELLARVLQSQLPLILDADALNLLARDPMSSEHWILTPHPGEAARLLQTTAAAVTSDRFTCIRRLHENYGGVCVLKGSGTLIADGATIQICSGGNPGMASGGMGDVLTGIIAGLVAQKYSLADAARMGVALHAAAGDAAAESGERGMLATDLLPWVRNLIN